MTNKSFPVIMTVAGMLIAVLFFLYMVVATIGGARDRRFALLGALIGALSGVGFVVVITFLIYVALNLGSGDPEHFGRGLLAAIVVFKAAAPALIMGLIGCAIGARQGANWRPNESFTQDNWTPPDTAEVRRVVAGQITKPDADSNST